MRSAGSTWRSRASRPCSSISPGNGSTRPVPTFPITASSTRRCGGRGNEYRDETRPHRLAASRFRLAKRESTEPVRRIVRPRSPPDVPQSLGPRHHIRPAIHVARVLRQQFQRRLAGPRPADFPHEQLHRLLASGSLGDVHADRRNVRIDEHDPGQAVRIHEAHPADADDEGDRLLVEGPRIDDPRAREIPVMITAADVFGVTFAGDPLMWAGWILGIFLLGLGMSCFFLAVTASSTDWQTPGVISNFITMPLMFASGALLPLANFPSWMQAIASVNPVSFSALLGRGIVVFNTADWSYLGYLAIFATGMLVAGTAVASRYLKAE